MVPMDFNDIKTYLPHYIGILHKTTIPFSLQTSYVPVEYNKDDSLDRLWQIHDKSLGNIGFFRIIPDQSLMDLKIDIAKRIFTDCVFCEHRCRVNRKKESGKCKVISSTIASEFIHRGEEQIFVPSHTIFFSGCNFQCVFCQNYDISQYQKGFILSPEQVAELIKKRYQHNSMNVNWVGGEPTPNLLFILETIKKLNVPIPQIWNSNMYCTVETMKLLTGVIDVFLTDFKFGSNKCGEELAKIPHYFDVISRNHLIAVDTTEVFIRHLVLPNHKTCCSQSILSWIKKNIPEVLVHIMDQYHPAYQAHANKNLQHPCTSKEIQEIKEFAKKLDITLYDD